MIFGFSCFDWPKYLKKTHSQVCSENIGHGCVKRKIYHITSKIDTWRRVICLSCFDSPKCENRTHSQVRVFRKTGHGCVKSNLWIYTLSRDAVNVNIIIYIWKITQHMVTNIAGTMGHKIKNKKTLKSWYTVRYSVSNKQKPSTIPSSKWNNCIWASIVQLVAKISERHRKC